MSVPKKKTPFLILAGAAIFGIMGGCVLALTHDLPQIRSLESYKPSAVTRIYSADNELLAELFAEKREPVPFSMIPDLLKQAIIATEDRHFYHHTGIDIKGIARAVFKDISAGKFIQGASTLTQQLAKTLFLTPHKSLIRKLREAILAIQLERRYTKNEILGMYLNQVYFGSGAYGIESAAGLYFGKSVKDLCLSECALLAGLPKAPSRYSPLVNHTLAKKRRDVVLKQMLDTGVITNDDFEHAKRHPVPSKRHGHQAVKAPYFTEYVKSRMEDRLGSQRLYHGGLTLYSTLSGPLQAAAETALKQGINELYHRMKQKHIQNPDPQAALIALDVETGAILAMAGGKNFDRSPFNRAINARRQPGSAFKPIVFAHAVERGFTQNTMLLDAPVAYKGGPNGGDWEPQNFSKTYKGEITMRTALALSKNIPAVRLIEKLGVSSAIEFAHSLGIQSPLQPYLSLALGTSEMTLLELTAAYSVFPNKGKYIEPFAVSEVIDPHGRIIEQKKPIERIVMSREGAAVMVNMLEAVIREGTGRQAKILHRPVGGKTGTTNDYKDALFVGFSPRIAVGVWVGNDNHTTLGKWETGARAALPIWIRFMKKALESEEVCFFDIPDNTVNAPINPRNQRRAVSDTAGSVNALFIKGTEPR